MNVTEYLPAPGVRYLAQPHPGALFALGWVVPCGSRHETAATSGASHLLERLHAAGPEAGWSERAAALGLRRDSALAPEWTRYWLIGAREDAPAAARLLATWPRAGAGRAGAGQDGDGEAGAALDRARRGALLRLARRAERSDVLATDVLRRCWFGDQGLGRSTLGSPRALRSLDVATVAAHHGRTYGRGPLVVAAVGDVDHEHLAALVARSLERPGDGAASPQPPDDGSAADDAPGGSGPADDGRAPFGGLERATAQQHVMLAVRGVGLLAGDLATWTVASYLLGGDGTSWLFRDVRERLGLTYAISARLLGYTDGGLMFVHGSTPAETSADFAAALAGSLVRFTAAGVTDAEVVAARTRLERILVMREEDVQTKLQTLLTCAHGGGAIRTLETSVDEIRAVAPDDVRKVIASWTAHGRPVVATVGPRPAEELHRAVDAEADRAGWPR